MKLRMKRNDAKGYIFPVLFLVAVVLMRPLAWARLLWPAIPEYETVEIFTAATLAILCVIGMLNAKRTRVQGFIQSRYANTSIWIFGIILPCLLYREYNFHGSSGEIFLSDMLPILIVVVCALYYRQMRSLLIWFIALLALASMGRTFYDLSLGREVVAGFVGNWNWNATALVIGIPALIYLLLKYFPLSEALRQKTAWTSVAFVMLLVILLPTVSRGTLFAFFLSVVLLLVIFKGGKMPTILKLCAALLFIMTLAVFLAIGLSDNSDIRFPLWQGTVNLIGDYPLFGVGTTRFVAFIDNYLPESYFLKPFATNLHPHPHNELLFIFASYGLIGGILLTAWLLLTAWKKFFFLRRRVGGNNFVDFYYFFVFCMLFFHAMVDTILQNFPFDSIFWIILGIFAGSVSAAERQKNFLSEEEVKFFLHLEGKDGMRRTVALLLGAVMFFLLFCDLKSSLYMKKGMGDYYNGEPESAGIAFAASIRFHPTMDNYYNLAQIELFHKNAFAEAAAIIETMNRRFAIAHYLESARMAGYAYFFLREYPLAWDSFAEALRANPFDLVTLYEWERLFRSVAGWSEDELARLENRRLEQAAKLLELKSGVRIDSRLLAPVGDGER